MATKVCVTWNGTGGELDSRVVTGTDDQLDTKIRDALIEMVSGGIVSVGDTFEVRVCE